MVRRCSCSAKQSLSLSLAINELATNATKYGALSAPDGMIEVVWQAGEAGSAEAFRLVWREDGGPPVTPPTRKGFGSRLIEETLAADFGGDVTVDYNPDGLRCELVSTMRALGNDTES